MHIVTVSDFVVRRRPKSYRADGMTVAGNKGMYLASFPRPYPRTRQQRRVAEVADQCGIRKGISRSELRRKMIDCVGPTMRRGG